MCRSGHLKEEMEYDMAFLNELQLAIYVFQEAVSTTGLDQTEDEVTIKLRTK